MVDIAWKVVVREMSWVGHVAKRLSCAVVDMLWFVVREAFS